MSDEIKGSEVHDLMSTHLKILERLSAMLTRIAPAKRKAGIELDVKMARTFPRGYVEKVHRERDALEEDIRGLKQSLNLLGQGGEYYRGQRVRLKRDVDRYPSFIARKGLVGTIVSTPGPDHMNLAVKMDEHLNGAEEWDNEIHWIEDLDMEWVHGDLEIIEPGHIPRNGGER